MARLLVAIACLVVTAASLLAVSRWLGGRDRGADGAPIALARPAPVGAAPPPLRAPEAPSAGSGDAGVRSWAEVARAAEAREQKLRDAITAAADGADAPVDHKLDLYRRALRDAFEGSERQGILAQRDVLTEIFLRMDSVQEELAAMSPSERRGELEHIRREMGYTDEQIARMAEIDDRRESRWQNGLAYMAERRRLVGTFEGEALQEELSHLRDAYFGDEAVTIEREEEDGFFRYERPRVYGRN